MKRDRKPPPKHLRVAAITKLFRDQRIRRNWEQGQVAEHLKKSRPWMSMAENAKLDPSLSDVLAWADALGLTISMRVVTGKMPVLTWDTCQLASQSSLSTAILRARIADHLLRIGRFCRNPFLELRYEKKWEAAP